MHATKLIASYGKDDAFTVAITLLVGKCYKVQSNIISCIYIIVQQNKVSQLTLAYECSDFFCLACDLLSEFNEQIAIL